MKEMAQVLHHLNVRVKEEQEVLERFEKCEFSDVDEFIVKGTIEGLEYAIKQIEEAMEQSQRAEAVNSMTNYLLTGDRGEDGEVATPKKQKD